MEDYEITFENQCDNWLDKVIISAANRLCAIDQALEYIWNQYDDHSNWKMISIRKMGDAYV